MAEEHAPALPAASGAAAAPTTADAAASARTASTGRWQMFAINRSLDFPDNRLTDEEAKGLADLKNFLKDHPLEPPEAAMGFDDYDLAKFVVVAKCNMEKCHKRMQNFVKYTAKYKLGEVSMEEVAKFQLSLKSMFGHAPVLDKEGRYSTFQDAGTFVPSQFKSEKQFQLLVKLFFVLCDLLTSTIAHTRKGCVFIADCKEFGWKNFDRDFEQKMSGLYQDCYPIKFARMLMVNPPWYISAIMTIMKLFLKKKIADRMVCVWTEKVGKDKLLSTYVSRHEVPAGLGGSLTDEFHPWMASTMGFAPTITAKATPQVSATEPVAKKSDTS